MPYATIDIGTNSVLLLIATPPLQVVTDQARITRLGEGLHESQTFAPASIKRTLAVLEEYDTLCRRHRVKKIICVGTAAFRKAKNGPDFMNKIQKRFGWETRIISGEEEARFSYLSVEHDFGDPYPNLVALDIGGGSTEIISKEGEVSLELGTVILTEKYLRRDPPTENEIFEIDKIILSHLGRVLSRVPPTRAHPLRAGGRPTLATRPSSTTLVALAGTATTLSSVNQKLKEWDPTKIQGSKITLPELDKMISLFQRSTHDALRATPGMVPGREDTLLAGALILKAVMEKLGTKRVIVSDRGLRYGVFYQEFSVSIDLYTG